MDEKRVLLSVGDDSGDLHAANLMRAMVEQRDGLRFVGYGMERMREAGLQPLGAPEESVIWLKNLWLLGRYRRRMRRCCELLDGGGVDLVVPVDFGGFNLCLCRQAARRGVPVFYYIPPQVWAHGRYRLKKLRRWTTRCGLIYPFEPALYRRWGVEADYVGHPLFDEMEANPPDEDVVDELKERFGDRLVGVFPGSRRQEVRAHMPLLVDSIGRIGAAVPEARFAALTPDGIRPAVEKALRGTDVPIELLGDARPPELARAAHLCIAKSGTVTLEIAAQRTPMVIFYRPGAFVCFLAFGLSDTPYFGLVNALAGRMICPEKAMARPAPGWLAAAAVRLLSDRTVHRSCRSAMEEALGQFARPGASERAARSALELL